MSKIRILHLITRLPIGGAERMLLGVLRNLDSGRFDSIVCCIQDRGELAEEVERLGIPLVALGLMRGGRFDREVIPTLRRLIREKQIALLHAHLYHANLYGRLAAWREGIPAIASVHNTYSDRRKWHRHLANRLLARCSFRVTVGSAEVERDVLGYDHVDPDRLVRLPNCIDLDRVSTSLTVAQAKARLGFAATDLVIGAVGRMEEQKGHRYLLAAFAALRKMPELSVARTRLLIVGDGRQRAQTEELAANLGITEVCRFPGSIKDLSEVYRAIDIFVMSSMWEGLSLAMLEAMAAGLPVISTKVGGAHDVLGDNLRGILVPEGDAEALAEALRDLIMDPKKQHHLADSGRNHVRKHYSVAAMTRELAALYEAAVESAGERVHERD
jgi:glycosyltransferase involved in cell wall biosynthesis